MLFISWVSLFVIAIGTTLFKVERKNAKRIQSDHTGTIDSLNTLKFFSDKVFMENKAVKSTGELKYNQFYAVLESKDYFIFYFTAYQASLIRKKDVDNLNDLTEYLINIFGNKYRKI